LFSFLICEILNYKYCVISKHLRNIKDENVEQQWLKVRAVLTGTSAEVLGFKNLSERIGCQKE
jgi:hypothetical protein